MFHVFRSRKQAFRIMLAVIVAPVIITMVVTLIPGIGSTSSSGSDAVLAEVAGEPVTLRETQREFQEYVTQQKVPAGAYNFIAPKILQDLIEEKAMLQEAERLGLSATDEELADLLRTALPFLFKEGSFLGRDQYAAFVQDRFQKSIPEFEESIKKSLILDTKLRKLVTDGVFIRPEEVDREYKRRNEKAKIEFVSVSQNSMQASVSSTAAEIEEHFKKNRATYTLPERRSIQYMVIDDAKVAGKVQITPQELQRYYNENRERFRVQDRAHVTHILLKTTEKKEDEIKKIEAQAQDILKQVRAGKDFVELAKTYSEDTVSAAKGGDIGWVTRGQTVPEFEQKAFSMKSGEVSDVVKTQYGFHIIKVLEREEPRVKPFPEVEATIRQEISRDRTETERTRLAERARAAASKYGQKIQDAGREVGVPVLTATLIEKGAALPQAGSEPGLMDALFSAVKGVAVGPITSPSKSVIAVVTDIQPSRQAELQEVYERVKNETTAAKARDAAQARAKEVAQKARSNGGDLRKAAKEFKLEVKTSEPFTREGSVPGVGPGSMLSEAFLAPVGSVIGPIAAGSEQVIAKVIDRSAPDSSAASADEKKSIKEQMLGSRQNEAFEVFKSDLRDRLAKQGKIKIYQDRVDRFTKSRS